MATVKLIRFSADKCTGCKECETACSGVHFKNDQGGEFSAIRIESTDSGFKMTNCNMCGLCIDMCPTQAIKRLPNGTVIRNKSMCVGCLSCVGFCPQGVFRKAPGESVPFKCIACGKCVKACPSGALELVEVELSEVEAVVYHKQGVC